MVAAAAASHGKAGLLRWVSARLRGPDLPVLTKELRVRMRGARAFLIMLGYVVTLSLFAVGYLFVTTAASGILSTGAMRATTPDVYIWLVRRLFATLAVAQLALVVALAPALTCGAITVEREQQTLEMLGLTLIPSRSVVVGKFLASLCYVVLLLLCSVPVFTFTLMLGGVSPLEILTVYLVTFAAALFFGAQGLLASAIAKRTYAATVLAYGLTGFWLFGFFASAWGPAPFLFFCAVTLAGLATVAAHGLVPRLRPGARAQRVTHIAVFGFTFCAVLALLNAPFFLDSVVDLAMETSLNPNPYVILYALSLGQQGGQYAGPSSGYSPYGGPYGLVGVARTAPIVWPAVCLGALSLLGAALAMCAATSLFGAARAPQADPPEVAARAAADLFPDTASREDAS